MQRMGCICRHVFVEHELTFHHVFTIRLTRCNRHSVADAVSGGLNMFPAAAG